MEAKESNKKIKWSKKFKANSMLTQDGWVELKKKQKKEAKPLKICAIGKERVKVTVDSAAEESVSPADWASRFPLDPVVPGRELKLVNANGGKINHYGKRRVAFSPSSNSQKCLGLGFEVTDVRKPLAAVFRICEQGNIVQFGPEEADNYIKNKGSGEKIYMKREGNSYVIEGDLCDANTFHGQVNM